MSGTVDCDKQGAAKTGTCLPGQEGNSAAAHCGQCSSGSRQAPAAANRSTTHSCKAHMPPARTIAESLIPFMFLLAVLGLGVFLMGSPRKPQAPESIKLTSPSSGEKGLTVPVLEKGK